MANVGRYRDSNPDIKAAGGACAIPEGGAAALMAFNPDSISNSSIPKSVERQQARTNPAPGARTYYPNNVQVSDDMVFGSSSGKDSDKVANLINPRGESKLQTAVAETRTGMAPLGQPRNHNTMPPEFKDKAMGTASYTEGVLGDTAADCFQKQGAEHNDDDPEQEAKVEAMYKKSHGALAAGEQVRRNYTESFDENKMYGKPTPCAKGGELVAKTLQWERNAKVGLDDSVDPLSRPPQPEYLPKDPNFTFGGPGPKTKTRGAAVEEEGEEEEEPDSAAKLMMDATYDAQEERRQTQEFNQSRQEQVLLTTRTMKHITSAEVEHSSNDGAGAVITPTAHTKRGLTKTDMSRPRPKKEIEVLFKRLAVSGNLTFDEVWEAIKDSGDETASVEALQTALIRKQ